jgi:hypothetical protein
MEHQVSLIHIGLAKTATTSLQRNLLSRHPEIYYFGYENCDVSMRWVFKMIKSQDSMDYRQFEVSRLINGIFERNPLGNKKLVVSDELLTLPCHPEYTAVDRAVIAGRLWDTFGPSRILMVIRRPKDLLGALYSEWMRMYGTYHILRADFEAWVTGMLNTPTTTWLSLLKYHDIYQLYGRIFGFDSIALYLYEELERDNAAFATRVCQYVGVSQAGAEELFGEKHLRSRLKQWQVRERLIFTPHPRLWRIYHNLTGRRPISIFMNRFLPDKLVGAHLSPETTARIDRRFRSQYEKLASNTGLDLKSYGYWK